MEPKAKKKSKSSPNGESQKSESPPEKNPTETANANASADTAGTGTETRDASAEASAEKKKTGRPRTAKCPRGHTIRNADGKAFREGDPAAVDAPCAECDASGKPAPRAREARPRTGKGGTKTTELAARSFVDRMREPTPSEALAMIQQMAENAPGIQSMVYTALRENVRPWLWEQTGVDLAQVPSMTMVIKPDGKPVLVTCDALFNWSYGVGSLVAAMTGGDMKHPLIIPAISLGIGTVVTGAYLGTAMVRGNRPHTELRDRPSNAQAPRMPKSPPANHESAPVETASENLSPHT